MANTGYWMPFEAAKAVAASFCWKIRYALTPVFGPDFPEICLHPDSEKFGDMVIDPAITRRCTEEAKYYRLMENKASSRTTSVLRHPLTPDSPTFPNHIKQLRSKPRQLAEAASGYSSDASFEDSDRLTPVSPSIPYCNTWTPANTPRSVDQWFGDRLPSPREILAGISAHAAKADREASASSSSSSTTSLLLRSRPPMDGDDDEADEDYDDDDVGSSYEATPMMSNPRGTRRKRSPSPLPSDEKAAYLLMNLRMKKTGLSEVSRGQKRRASA
jgi:hypothetical protein